MSSSVGAADGRGAAGKSARRASLHRRTRVPPASARRPTTPTTGARRRSRRRPRAQRAASPTRLQSDPRDRLDAAIQRDTRRRRARTAGRERSRRCWASIAPAGDQHELAHAQHERRAVAGRAGATTSANMVGFDGTGLTPADRRLGARPFRRRTCAAGGPFPALRCGRQPYGVLPVTSLDLWKPPRRRRGSAARDIWLRDMLITLRDNVWRPRLPLIARLGSRQATGRSRRRSGGRDAHRRCVQRLQRAQRVRRPLPAASARVHRRGPAGGRLRRDPGRAGGRVCRSARHRMAAARCARVVRRAGMADDRAAGSGGRSFAVEKLEPNYIARLLADAQIDEPSRAARSAATARADESAAGAAASRAAARSRRTPRRSSRAGETRRRPRRVAARCRAGRPRAPARRRHRAVAAPARRVRRRASPAPSTIRAVPRRPGRRSPTPAIAALGDFRASLAHLQALDSETLQYLMQGTLDLSSHRLDAWITSFATKRLARDARARRRRGVYVGGYGWVENLAPAPAARGGRRDAPAGRRSRPARRAANDSGFIHAPSLTHAAAAALLRNAHLGPNGTARRQQSVRDRPVVASRARGGSAARRRAQGQPLGALLGYRFERGLHDLALGRLAIPRDAPLAPLVARRSTPTPTADRCDRRQQRRRRAGAARRVDTSSPACTDHVAERRRRRRR